MTPAQGSHLPDGQGAEAAHPLRLHWEYLSYVFRKLPALSATEELERSYRDFLQVAPSHPAIQHGRRSPKTSLFDVENWNLTE